MSQIDGQDHNTDRKDAAPPGPKGPGFRREDLMKRKQLSTEEKKVVFIVTDPEQNYGVSVFDSPDEANKAFEKSVAMAASKQIACVTISKRQPINEYERTFLVIRLHCEIRQPQYLTGHTVWVHHSTGNGQGEELCRMILFGGKAYALDAKDRILQINTEYGNVGDGPMDGKKEYSQAEIAAAKPDMIHGHNGSTLFVAMEDLPAIRSYLPYKPSTYLKKILTGQDGA